MKEIATAYLFFGEDEFPSQAAARHLIHSILPEAEQAFGLEVYDGQSDTIEKAQEVIGQVIAALRTMTFLSRHKIVWLQRASFLGEDAVRSAAEGVKTKVKELLVLLQTGIPEGHILVVTASKVDKRSAFYKAFPGIGEAKEFALSEKTWELDKNAVIFACGEFAKAGLSVDEDARELFLLRVGPDSRQIANEVVKLATFLGNRRTAGVADVEAIVSSTRGAQVWDLEDAFGTRDLARALQHTRQLFFQKESGVRLLFGLESRVKLLLLFREALDRGWLAPGGGGWNLAPDMEAVFAAALGRDVKQVHPFRVRRMAEQAAQFTVTELLLAQRRILAAHAQLVTQRVSESRLIELLLIRLLRARGQRAKH